ncbi:hypothetical protein F6X68_29695 [Micromonospora sp. AMSO12t]|uniref:hypothetical protein n=1 Tax=Micromonospora sp. AMSO12t TaxID=2650410 RepID=UPI00124B6079|nr:hypothetical protein [Micromonospora sp. AMSO12t]KAB1128959.1 hypothetical protein F6X68_29695 [Micromonospora sp. AMSO12t]
MSVDHGDRVVADAHGELTRAVGALEARRFRGGRWLSADEVSGLARSADERSALLGGEVDRLRRENEGLARQVEMLRHGALPSTGAQGPDPMVIELAVRAQDEANRTIGEASAEGAEIIAEARRQADEIIAEAHVLAGGVAGPAGAEGEELRRQVRELEGRQAALVAAVATAQQHLSRWQAYLSEQSEQLRSDAEAAGAVGAQLRAVLGE